MEQNNYKLGNKTLIVSAILALLILFLCSCSARKVDKSKTTTKEVTQTETSKDVKEETKKESETNIKETKTTTIDEAKNIVTEVTEIVPVDQTKEATFTDAKGQKFNLNNSKYRNEKTSDLSTKKFVEAKDYLEVKKDLETVIKIAEEREKTIIELQKQIDIKNSDKKQFNFLSLWWLLLIIPIYFVLRKYWRLF